MDAIDVLSVSWWCMAQYFIDGAAATLRADGLTRGIESSLIKGLILARLNHYSREMRDALGVKLRHYRISTRQYIHDNAREAFHR